VTVTVNPLPTVTASANPSSIIPGGTSLLTATGASSYLWSNGATTGSTTVAPASTTTYTVTGTNAAGCSATASTTVTVIASTAWLGGTLSYNNSAATPMGNTQVYLKVPAGPVAASDSTDATGNFIFNGLANGTYVTGGSCSHDWGGGNSVDALLILRHFANYDTLEGLCKRAGDVDLSGYLNTNDALLVVLRFIDSIGGFAAGDWVFDNDTILFSGVNTTHHLQALCYGDVNGSHVPGMKSLRPAELLGRDYMAINQSAVRMPVYLSDPANLGSVSLRLLFNNALVTVTGIEFNTGLGVAAYRISAGSLKAGWYHTEAWEVNTDEPFAWISLEVAGGLMPGQVLEANDLLIGAEIMLSDPRGMILDMSRLVLPGLKPTQSPVAEILKVYPNPFTEGFVLDISLPGKGVLHINITDISGRIVTSRHVPTLKAGVMNQMIGLEKAAPGLYFLDAAWYGENNEILNFTTLRVVKY
jgi:hypothetical protein